MMRSTISRAAMLLLMMVLTTASAWADDVTVASETTSWTDGNTYNVTSNVTISSRITVTGDVTLVLGNNATLNALMGITVSEGASLTINALSEDEDEMGVLNATTGANNDAAIGGIGNLNFNFNTPGQNAGDITINGGKINATANAYGAAIGSCGYSYFDGSAKTVGTITINGGIINATSTQSSHCGAGIGSGCQGKASTINLYGGTIHAEGIGSGYGGASCDITINISDNIKEIVAQKVDTEGQSECIGKGTYSSANIAVNFYSGGNIVEGDDKLAVFDDSGEGDTRTIRSLNQNYQVNISNNIKNLVSTSHTSAPKDATVTLTLDVAVIATTLKVNDGTNDLTLTDVGNRQYTFTMPESAVTVTADVAQTYSLTLPENMELTGTSISASSNGKYITGTVISFKPYFPYEASNVTDGTNTLTPTDGTYSATIGNADLTVTADFVRNHNIDLSQAPSGYHFTAIDGDILSGYNNTISVTIAGGAGITLSEAAISNGIVCAGTATITLVGNNTVANKSITTPAIQVGVSGTTLTINGSGSLTTTSGNSLYGTVCIGTDEHAQTSGGTIIIEGGTITATGGVGGNGTNEGTGFTHPGIGVGEITNSSATLDGIIIKGGHITTTGIGCRKSGIQAIPLTITEGIAYIETTGIYNCSTQYQVGETDVTASVADYFTIVEDGDARTITLREHPISYDLAGGTVATPNPTVYTAGTAAITLLNPTREGYTFTGWTGTGLDAATMEVTIASGSKGDRNYTATWTTIPWSGSGDSAEDPYIIEYPSQLDLLATNVNAGNSYSGKFFKLGKDITYTHTTDWDDATSTENNYTAIGQRISNNTADDHPFSGTFDGDGHTVSGIRIYKSGSGWSDHFQGLFGYVTDGTVKNVTLADARITGEQNVGGIVGWLGCDKGSPTIENCHVLSNVTIHAVEANSYFHGGIAGSSDGSVLRCTSAATLTIKDGITGCEDFGGIVGCANGTLRHNMAIGCTIPAVPYSGAIVGENYVCTFEYNYYGGCTVGGATSNIGCNGEDIVSEIDDWDVLQHPDGAVPATILSDAETTLPELTEGTKVAFHRQFTGGKASTVVFPFAYTPSAAEGKYYTFSGVGYEEGKWIATMNEVEGENPNIVTTLEANTPYLFMPAGTDGIVPVLFHGAVADEINAGTTVNEDWCFVGTYEKKTWAAAGNDYGFAATSGKAVDGVTDVNAGDFVKFAAGAWLRPMRCYLTYKGTSAGAPALDAAAPELPSSISVVLVKADGSTTTIDNGELRIENSTDAWHTLDGRRLSGKPTQRGIYINNGKKIVIK